jgi:hypothetical protein
MLSRVPSILLLLGVLAFLGGSLQAQTQLDPARAATATQTVLSASPRETSQKALRMRTPFANRSPGDSDLGQQLLLKPRVNPNSFKFWLDSSYYWTDNAANQATE